MNNAAVAIVVVVVAAAAVIISTIATTAITIVVPVVEGSACSRTYCALQVSRLCGTDPAVAVDLGPKGAVLFQLFFVSLFSFLLFFF